MSVVAAVIIYSLNISNIDDRAHRRHAVDIYELRHY